jgi:AraC-like DNA-binding protein
MGRPLSPQEDTNRRMLRARDEMDRRYAEPLDVPTLAGIAHLSVSQFGRVFKEVYGETPHRYLQRRRVERAMTLLRQTDRPVTDIAWDVGFASLGTFSRTFSNVVGCAPTEFRARHTAVAVPSCFIAAWTRPRDHEEPVDRTGPAAAGRLPDSGFGEAEGGRRWLASST